MRRTDRPREGAALGGGERSGEGPWQHGLDHWKGSSPSGPGYLRMVRSHKIAAEERRKGAPARKGRRGAFAEVPQETCAVPALRLPQGRQQKDPGGPGTSKREIWRSARFCRAEPKTHVCGTL